MSQLEDFTNDQRELLVSLPYRTGLWISRCDDSGGEEAFEAEMQVLESLITGFAEDFLKSEFVEELMRETLAQRGKWEIWSGDLGSVPSQCREAVAFISKNLDQKDVLSFRQNLMEIAVAVATAYREAAGADIKGSGSPVTLPFLGDAWGKLMTLLKKSPPSAAEEPGIGNVSAAERAALEKLAGALRVDFDGTPLDNAAAA